MSSNILLSPIEHKILLVLGFLICSLYFVSLSDKFITNYNKAVESEQIEKGKVANNEERISFGLSHCYSTPIYETILGLQIFTIPLLVLSLWKPNFARFVSSVLLTSFILFGYVGWMIFSYTGRKSNDFFFRVEDTTFNTYIFFQSTVLEFILFLAIALLFIIQLAILLRFAIEKLQAKIA